jgi:hypothetical protein
MKSRMRIQLTHYKHSILVSPILRWLASSLNSPHVARDVPTHVIVKFSGSDDTPQERRWADLLICEHLALTTITDTLKLEAANSRIYQFSGRTFYEVDRFDRHGEFGRSGVCSWHELNAALFVGTGNWSDGADALLHANYISEETTQKIKLLAHFGRMIGNTDMHDGNLAFLPDMRLAPVYDMLPMMYARQRGVELVERKLNLALPLPKERENLLLAAMAASVFWRRVEGNERISSEFRRIAGVNAELVDRLVLGQGG